MKKAKRASLSFSESEVRAMAWVLNGMIAGRSLNGLPNNVLKVVRETAEKFERSLWRLGVPPWSP